MRNTATACLVLSLAAVLPVSTEAQDTDAAPVSETELQRLYTEYLTEEGYRPEVDEDGDVRFKREGRLYFINVAEDDPEFFTVVLANIWPIESETERSLVRAAADASNAKSKVSKVFTINDDVWVSIELFVEHPEDFKGVFERAMSGIDNGVAEFIQTMKELASSPERSLTDDSRPKAVLL